MSASYHFQFVIQERGERRGKEGRRRGSRRRRGRRRRRRRRRKILFTTSIANEEAQSAREQKIIGVIDLSYKAEELIKSKSSLITSECLVLFYYTDAVGIPVGNRGFPRWSPICIAVFVCTC